MLAIFNLLPVPPLDGSTLLFRFLSPQQVWQIRPILAPVRAVHPPGDRPPAGRVLGSDFIFGVTDLLVGVVRPASSGRTSPPA